MKNKFFEYGLLVFLLGLAVLFFVIDPNKSEIFPKCIFHSVTGYHCPGCGSQRAIHSLLHLDLMGVVGNNFLFIPAFLLIGYHYSHPVFNKKFNLKLPNLFYLKYTPWVILAIVVLFWILRNLPWFPFTVLAP